MRVEGKWGCIGGERRQPRTLQIKDIIASTGRLFEDVFIHVSQLLKRGGEQDIEVALAHENRFAGYHRPTHARLYNGCVRTWHRVGQRGEVREKQTMTRKMRAE